MLIPTLLLASLAATPEPIQLDELLAATQASHPLFARESRRVEIERQVQARAEGTQDWNLFSNATYVYQEPAQSGPFVAKEIQDVSVALGIDRTIWETGGRLSASWAGGYLDQRISGLAVGPVSIPASHVQQYRSGAFLNYSQPLLQNLGGLLNRLDYELAAASITLAEVQALENQETFLLGIAGRYVEWAVLREEARITKERLALAEAQLEQTKKKRRANLVDAADVLRALDAVQTAKQAVYLVDSRVTAARAELAVLTQIRGLDERVPAFDLYTTAELPGAESLGDSRVIRALEATADQIGMRLSGAEEATRPELLASFGVGLRRNDDDVGEALGLNKPDAFAGLTFSYPLGNRAAEAEVERQRLHKKQVADQIREVTLQLESGRRGLEIRIRELVQVLELNREQIESATQKTNEELRLYNQGRGQLTFVIAARDDVQRAKLNYARNAATYQQLLLQYRELVDELLPSSERRR